MWTVGLSQLLALGSLPHRVGEWPSLEPVFLLASTHLPPLGVDCCVDQTCGIVCVMWMCWMDLLFCVSHSCHVKYRILISYCMTYDIILYNVHDAMLCVMRIRHVMTCCWIVVFIIDVSILLWILYFGRMLK